MDNVKQVEIDQIKNRLVELLKHDDCPLLWMQGDVNNLASYLLANGVRLENMQATSDKTSDESKRIVELETALVEREKVVIQLRKQWQDAEMHICTMCGHFAHKRDGGIVYGNRNCDEIAGYPYCAEKFTPWIPVAVRLPDTVPCDAGTAYSEAVNVLTSGRKVLTAIWDGTDFIADAEFWEAENEEITHWTPVPLPLPAMREKCDGCNERSPATGWCEEKGMYTEPGGTCPSGGVG